MFLHYLVIKHHKMFQPKEHSNHTHTGPAIINIGIWKIWTKISSTLVRSVCQIKTSTFVEIVEFTKFPTNLPKIGMPSFLVLLEFHGISYSSRRGFNVIQNLSPSLSDPQNSNTNINGDRKKILVKILLSMFFSPSFGQDWYQHNMRD